MNSPNAPGFCCGVQVQYNKENFSRAAILCRRTHPTCTYNTFFFPFNDIHAKHPSLSVYLKKKRMHLSDERSFILSILLLPFLILIPLLLFILSNSPPPLIKSKCATPSSTSFLPSEPAKAENPRTKKRQKHIAFQDNTSTFITPRNYHGTSTSNSGSGFHPMGYQGQKSPFITPRQNYDRGTSSHGTTSNTSFEPMAYHRAQAHSFIPPCHNYHRSTSTCSTSFQSIPPINNNSGNNHNKNNRPILETSITNTNQHHGAAAGRTTSFQNSPIKDTKHYYHNNNNNTIPAQRIEEENVQFPNMLDLYSSLPPISPSSPF